MMKFLPGAVAILMWVASMTAIATRSTAAQTITATEAQNGKTLVVSTGDALLVSLESNPSTGYGWQVSKNDPAILKLVGAPVYQPASHPMPGAPGHQLFKFEATSAGSDAIELTYARPWEKGVAPARTYSLIVKVK